MVRVCRRICNKTLCSCKNSNNTCYDYLITTVIVFYNIFNVTHKHRHLNFVIKTTIYKKIYKQNVNH